MKPSEIIYPPKLRPGSRLRVISPSRSLGLIGRHTRSTALDRLRRLGFEVSFGRHVEERDELDSSSVASRVSDLHEAFADRSVDGILTVIGGYNSNQLLGSIDYDLIRANPKVFCGFSDITALGTAILSRAGLVTYSGPHFSSFGMDEGFDYTEDYFTKCVTSEEPYSVEPSRSWSDDLWFLESAARRFDDNEGPWVVAHGSAAGRLVGGNLVTLALLGGTGFGTIPECSILFVEDDEEANPPRFERSLQALSMRESFAHVTGMVVGRFQRQSGMSRSLLEKIVKSNPRLARLPVAANLDFGHTSPVATLPIGGEAELEISEDLVRFTVVRH